MRPRFLVEVLPGESEVDRCGGCSVNDGFTKRLAVGTPCPLPRLVRRHVGRAQVVRVQVVPLRAFVSELAVADVSLPDGVGAPEAVSLGIRVEAVGFGQRSLLVCLGHEAALAIDVVGGLARLALRDDLGNSSAEGVIGVAAGAVVALVLYFAQALGSVVGIAALPVQALFFFGVACLGVADGDGFIHDKAISKRGEVARVAGELVVLVVFPDAALAGAGRAVAHFVVEVVFFWQAKLFVFVIWFGIRQPAQFVVGVGGSACVGGGDVAQRVGFGQDIALAVMGVAIPVMITHHWQQVTRVMKLYYCTKMFTANLVPLPINKRVTKEWSPKCSPTKYNPVF